MYSDIGFIVWVGCGIVLIIIIGITHIHCVRGVRDQHYRKED